jgi:hypothetical protein
VVQNAVAHSRWQHHRQNGLDGFLHRLALFLHRNRVSDDDQFPDDLVCQFTHSAFPPLSPDLMLNVCMYSDFGYCAIPSVAGRNKVTDLVPDFQIAHP